MAKLPFRRLVCCLALVWLAASSCALADDAPSAPVTPPKSLDDPANPYRDRYTPLDRWVTVHHGDQLLLNDQLLHEGESLSPGLVLEQITPDGMVFSFRGYRFRQGVQ